jgi:hypothetical protein
MPTCQWADQKAACGGRHLSRSRPDGGVPWQRRTWPWLQARSPFPSVPLAPGAFSVASPNAAAQAAGIAFSNRDVAEWDALCRGINITVVSHKRRNPPRSRGDVSNQDTMMNVRPLRPGHVRPRLRRALAQPIGRQPLAARSVMARHL